MPYDFNWHDAAHSIIRLDIHGEVTWEQWYQAIDKVVAELAKTSQRIDLIFNDTVGMPKGNPMPHLKTTTGKLISYPNMGLVITVSQKRVSIIVKTIVDIMMRVYRMDMSHYGGFIDSLADAEQLIARDRAKKQTAV